MDNMTWESDRFDIEATSEQLRMQYETTGDSIFELDSEYYSTFVIDGNSYYCIIYLVNGYFSLYLAQPELLEDYYDYYEEGVPFLFGVFEDEKTKNEDYQYRLIVTLDKDDSAFGTTDGEEAYTAYYQYCTANDIQYDDELILYGYKSS
ncbi:MAG TPA: hypothetical protein PLH02_05385 [Bacillota bacterium]|nr:hypothetical protein [Bacillota bacterium]HPF42608.1 hypothetical protein [Bacillota bacterium]HPQ62277.1 hypothetical protein [Bacillota bacterium]